MLLHGLFCSLLCIYFNAYITDPDRILEKRKRKAASLNFLTTPGMFLFKFSAKWGIIEEVGLHSSVYPCFCLSVSCMHKNSRCPVKTWTWVKDKEKGLSHKPQPLVNIKAEINFWIWGDKKSCNTKLILLANILKWLKAPH